MELSPPDKHKEDVFLVSSFRGKGRKRENGNNVDDSISSSSSSRNYKLFSGSMWQGKKCEWSLCICKCGKRTSNSHNAHIVVHLNILQVINRHTVKPSYAPIYRGCWHRWHSWAIVIAQELCHFPLKPEKQHWHYLCAEVLGKSNRGYKPKQWHLSKARLNLCAPFWSISLQFLLLLSEILSNCLPTSPNLHFMVQSISSNLQPVAHPPWLQESPWFVVVWSASVKLPIGNTCHS